MLKPKWIRKSRNLLCVYMTTNEVCIIISVWHYIINLNTGKQNNPWPMHAHFQFNFKVWIELWRSVTVSVNVFIMRIMDVN